jgi:hypothetical protein
VNFRPIPDRIEGSTKSWSSAPPITGAGLANLEPLMSLQHLTLEATGVGDAGLPHLRGLARLDTLLLKETRVTVAGLSLLSLAEMELLSGRMTRVMIAGWRFRQRRAMSGISGQKWRSMLLHETTNIFHKTICRAVAKRARAPWITVSIARNCGEARLRAFFLHPPNGYVRMAFCIA